MTRAGIFAPAIALAAGVLLVGGIREQFTIPPAKDMAALPRTVLGTSGTDVVIGDEERRVAGMSDYALRAFTVDSATNFTTYVGYYDRQVQGKTIHSPKNCLPGAGWEILTSDRIAAQRIGATGTINRVVLANKGSRALVLYWYQGRGRVQASEYLVKWDLLRDAALYGRTEEALVRVVVPIAAPTNGPSGWAATEAHADRTAWAVARELLPSVSTVMPVLDRAS
jgi:EpsI family protein